MDMFYDVRKGHHVEFAVGKAGVEQHALLDLQAELPPCEFSRNRVGFQPHALPAERLHASEEGPVAAAHVEQPASLVSLQSEYLQCSTPSDAGQQAQGVGD